MFKGPIKVASHTTISNKDKKKLKKDLYNGFPTDVIDKIFEVTPDFSATKLQGVPFTIYSEEDAPLFVDSTGNGDLFPTIYAIDFYPDLCRNLHLKEGVETFVLKGANLMWPGVADIEKIPADMEVDNVVAIRKSDGTVIGIGAIASDPSKLNKEKPEGQAAFVLHIQGDSLWNVGSKEHKPPKWDRKTQEEKERAIAEKYLKKQAKHADEDDEDDTDKFAMMFSNKTQGSLPTTGPAGKSKGMPKELKLDNKGPKVVGKAEKKDAAPAKAAKGGKEEDAAGKKGKKDGKKEEKKGKKDEKKGGKKGKKEESASGSESDGEEEEQEEEAEELGEKAAVVEAKAESDAEGSESESEEDKGKNKGKGKKKGKATAGKKDAPKTEEVEGPVLTKEQIKEMDNKIYDAFLNAVKISLTADDLPIEIGKFWSDHIIKCRTVDSEELDLKSSSHKKIGKFLQQMQKDKLLTYEEANKKNPVPRITKVEFHAKAIADWTPTVTAKDLERRLKENEKEDKGAHSWRVPIEIVKVYKATDLVAPLLENSKGTMSKAEAEKQFMNYLKTNKLLEKDSVILNDDLKTRLGQFEDEDQDDQDEEEEMGDKGAGPSKADKKVRKGESVAKAPLKRVLEVFSSKLSQVHEIRNLVTKTVEVKPTAFKDVSIVAEKAHNKFVTRLLGLEPFQVDYDKLAGFFQGKFATAATVTDLPGKGNLRELTVQGTFVEELTDFLTKEMGIQEDLIKLTNKLDKKKEKGAKMR